MLRSLELWIALRYLRGQGRQAIFNLGVRLSFLFMSLMVFVMVIVLCVFAGFQEAVHKTLRNSGYHITIHRHSKQPMQEHTQIVQRISNNERLQKLVRESFSSISLNGLLKAYNQFEGKAVRALPVDLERAEEEQLHLFPRLIHYNRQLLAQFHRGNYILVGRELARFYGWQVGESVHLYLPRGGILRQGTEISEQEFTIAGFYRTGFYEYDLNLIFLSLATAQRVLKLKDRATEVIVQLKNLETLDYAERLVRDGLPQPRYGYSLGTIRQERGNFLAALKLEKTLMMVILSLLIIAGVAGIWITVHLLVKARARSIGMLRAMGLSTSSILAIFTANSMLIGILSATLGTSLGIYVAGRLETILRLFEDLLNSGCMLFFRDCIAIKLIPANIYYFDHLPVYADLQIIFGVALATIILSGLAGYFPARQAAALDPVQAIRND